MGRTRSSGGVLAASETSIEIAFQYRGVRCRERLKLAPTPRNLTFARNLLGQIRTEIAKGVFDYASHFPRSSRAGLLSPKPAALVTTSAALQTWFTAKKPELEHSTIIGYERAIDNVLTPALGEVLLRDLSRPMIKAFITGMGEVTSKRINNVLSPLRQMLAEAVDDGVLDNNPAEGIIVKRKRAADERDEVDPFEPVEMRAIIDGAEGQFQNLCQFAFFTGARTSELIALQWRDIDLVQGRVRIRGAFVMGKLKGTKTKAGFREITLLAPAIEAVKAQRSFTLLAGAHVFLNPATGESWKSDKQIREWNWRPLLKRLGVRYRYPYQMRHTFASLMLSSGENVLWVAKQMGHADWTITARTYARWIPSVQPDAGKEAMRVWDANSGVG